MTRAARCVLAQGLLLAAVAMSCGGARPSGAPAAAANRSTSEAPTSTGTSTVTSTGTSTVVPSATALPTPPPVASPTVDPGSLPQTSASPVATDRAFAARMAALWSAVVTGVPSRGHAAFFPLGAYEQVKAISDPAADWHNRLVAGYDLDLAALHRLVGSGARLLGVDVPAVQATWVPPGAEDNKGAYWRVYGSRVRYATSTGAQRSFGIFSLISWRGQWYVVHLGPLSRPAGTGAITP